MFDYQKVRLVWVTPEAENVIAYCARVSNPANQENYDTAPKLLKYLVKNKHWSPFEMASMCLEIETTRDIGRQILRHRSFSFQEFSQRYAAVDDNVIVRRQLRLQDTKNRQNSLKTDDIELAEIWRNYQDILHNEALNFYAIALEMGVAKEQARALLPEGLTMSRMYMSGSIRSWIHYCDIRSEMGVTQKEHVDIALKARAILLNTIPSLSEVLQASSQ